MMDSGPRADLRLRLQTLGVRIAKLKADAKRAEDVVRIEDEAEIEDLERRHAALERRRAELEREGPSLLGNLKADFEIFFDDLAAAIDNFTLRQDSRYEANRRTETDADR